MPGAEAGLAEGRRLLVAGVAPDGHGAAEQPGRRRAVEPPSSAAPRAASPRGCPWPPAAPRPRPGGGCRRAACGRVRDVGHVQRPAGEAPDEEAVDRPEEQLAALGPRLQARRRRQDVVDLGAAEVGVDGQARARPDRAAPARAPAARRRYAGRDPALPDDGVVDGAAGGPLPHDGRLALVGDADGGQPRARAPRPRPGPRERPPAATPRSPPGRARPGPARGRAGAARASARATIAPA